MLSGPGTKYGLYFIASNARMIRSVTAETPSAGGFMPRISVAGHSVLADLLSSRQSSRVRHNSPDVTSLSSTATEGPIGGARWAGL